MDKRASFTAAGEIPYKFLTNTDLVKNIKDTKIIPPYHINFTPTNRCNFDCNFCSFASRNRQTEMPIEEVEQMVAKLASLGNKAITITGGGEPMMHKNINKIIEIIRDYNIDAGMVTNGSLLRRLTEPLIWCRISVSDEKSVPEGLQEVVNKFPETEFGFSYVITNNPNLENLRAVVDFAEKNNFTHIRVLSDMLDLENENPPIYKAAKQVQSPLLIWQPRYHSEQGPQACLISNLRPSIGPDGQVYPCCAIQYAFDEPTLDFAAAMGHWSEMPFEPFNGSKCTKCFNGGYNIALDTMISPLKHKNFI